MSAFVRSFVALLAKELQHHTSMWVLLVLLTLPACAIGLIFSFGVGGA